MEEQAQPPVRKKNCNKVPRNGNANRNPEAPLDTPRQHPPLPYAPVVRAYEPPLREERAESAAEILASPFQDPQNQDVAQIRLGLQQERAAFREWMEEQRQVLREQEEELAAEREALRAERRALDETRINLERPVPPYDELRRKYLDQDEAARQANNERLWEAAQRGDLHEVQRLVIEGLCDVNSLDGRQRSALHRAALTENREDEEAAKEKTDVVEWLVKQADCTVNAQRFDGWTALHSAASNGFARMVRVLIEARCNLDLQDKNGCTALMRASEKGRLNAVELLLQAGADPEIQNLRGYTARYMVCNNVKQELDKVFRKLPR